MYNHLQADEIGNAKQLFDPYELIHQLQTFKLDWEVKAGIFSHKVILVKLNAMSFFNDY